MANVKISRREFLVLCAGLALAGCTKEQAPEIVPVEFSREHSCSVCGMIIVDFPGSKAQIHYSNGNIDTFCSTLDMFLFYLQPDRPVNKASVLVNDMGKADHEHPVNHWIDATKAYFVYGGSIMGPMGEALVPFSETEKAENYLKEHGGRIVRFKEVTMEMLRPDTKR